MRTMINRIFGYERIDGAGRCPYLHRWCLFVGPFGIRLYLHKFVGSDWSRDLHDHPKRFISIGLWGSYVEETQGDDARECSACSLRGFSPHCLECRGTEKHGQSFRRYRAPWLRSFPAHHIHRLILDCPVCWTLVLTLTETRAWGFWVRGEWIHWKKYVYSARADEAKDC